MSRRARKFLIEALHAYLSETGWAIRVRIPRGRAQTAPPSVFGWEVDPVALKEFEEGRAPLLLARRSPKPYDPGFP